MIDVEKYTLSKRSAGIQAVGDNDQYTALTHVCDPIHG